MATSDLDLAYQTCQKIVKQHYENFPVASLLLAKSVRKAISVIYAFARTADDFADEGNLSPQQRLNLLEQFETNLQKITGQTFDFCENVQQHRLIFLALNDVICRYQLPVGLFQDLLVAFKQDVTTRSYNNEKELIKYCQHSANPVGRLLLHLNGQANEKTLYYSDDICTALQLINFLQDIRQDAEEMDRLYIPLSDLDHFSISREQIIEDAIKGAEFDRKYKQIYCLQWQRAEKYLQQGKPLLNLLNGRLKREISMIFQGGSVILNKLKNKQSFADRPRLNSRDKLSIIRAGIF